MSVQESISARVSTQSSGCQTNLSLPANSSDLVTLSKVFSDLLGSDIHVPEDYLIYSAQAMNQLSISGRSNVLYKLSKGIGTMRPDNSDSCFPCKRMPMGMLEYMADFFACTVIQKVLHFAGWLSGGNRREVHCVVYTTTSFLFRVGLNCCFRHTHIPPAPIY